MTDAPNHAPAERWQHGSLPESGDTGGQSVQRPVNVLLRAGRLTTAHRDAAERYYRDYAIGWECVGGESSQGLGDHLVRYYAARHAVGFPGLHILALAVLNDVSVDATAAFYYLARPSVERLLITTLERLADHYAAVDGTAPAPESGIRAAGVK